MIPLIALLECLSRKKADDETIRTEPKVYPYSDEQITTQKITISTSKWIRGKCSRSLMAPSLSVKRLKLGQRADESSDGHLKYIN